jgi:hypothetical protein
LGTYTEIGNYKASDGKTTLDVRLIDILKLAAAVSPYNVQAISGVASRRKGTKNHIGGYAIDVNLVDPATSKVLDNYQKGAAFLQYEEFAQIAREIQVQKYPDLNDVFRWGGYFLGGTDPLDLMHFDINPDKGGATAGGSWDKGANSALKKNWSITSFNAGLGDADRKAALDGQITAATKTP